MISLSETQPHHGRRDEAAPRVLEALADHNITSIAGGWRHTLAADDQGRMYSWGWNKVRPGWGGASRLCTWAQRKAGLSYAPPPPPRGGGGGGQAARRRLDGGGAGWLADPAPVREL